MEGQSDKADALMEEATAAAPDDPRPFMVLSTYLGRRGDLAGAVAQVPAPPARAVGLADRGEIAIGKRADLVLLREIDGLSVVTGVWSAGRKVG